MRIHSKFAAIVLIGAITVGLAASAYAYFVAGGHGEGAAAVGTSSGVQLDATTSAAIYPGAPGIDVAIKVTNPGKATQHVGTVSLDSIDTPIGCTASDFTMAPVAVNQTLASAASTTVHG